MKKFIPLVMLVLAACLPALAQAAKKSGGEGKVERQLMQMESDWSAAYLRHDAAVIDRILAEDYVGVDGRGVVIDKAGELAEAAPPAPGAATPDRVILDEDVSDMRVRVYGNTAVVNGVATEKVRFKGNESVVRYRRTTVYVKRQGRWQCVSFHGSRILQPPQ